MKPALVIMLKEPRPGRVKTRLGKDMGMAQAARWFRRQSLGLLRSLGGNPKWRVVLAVSPDREGLESRVWPKGFERWPQGRGSLGDRMGRIFRMFPPGPVIIIGADIPGIRAKQVERAFRLLGSYDGVFGPADDGGYWLVGLKRVSKAPAGIFKGVRWSTEHALSDTLDTLSGLKIACVETLRDVDTLDDLAKLESGEMGVSVMSH